jgi:tetratricopeptide (TPR) repeat protein
MFVLTLCTAASATPVAESFQKIAQDAQSARSQDRVADAIRLYREGAHLRPSWSDGWWYLGSLLYDQDRFSEAADAFRHLMSATSHNGPAHAFLGLCDYDTGSYDDALVQFRAWAAAGWPATDQLRDVAVYHYALLLTRNGRFVESLYLLSTLAERLGETPELSEAMGLASLRMRNLPEDFPPEARERIWLAGEAASYAAQSPPDFDRADAFALRLEKRYPMQSGVHYFRGTLYGFEGKKPEAEHEYRSELTISPKDEPSLAALAALDLENGNLAEAGLFAQRAVEIDPNNSEAHHLLGRVFLENGDLQASLKELEIAKRLAPESPGVRAHLAMVYGRLGRTQDAKAESAAFLVLKNKRNIMTPPGTKHGATRENRP